MTGIAEELLGTDVEPVEAPAEPTPEATQEPPEAVAEQTDTETPPEPEKVEKAVEPTSTTQPETVPLSAHIGLRKDLERQIKELKAQQSKEPEKKIDFFEDPDGAIGALESKMSETLTNQLLNAGQGFAVRQHGQETVDQAIEWVTQAVQASPFLAQQFSQTPLMEQPLKAVELFQQEQARAEMENPAELKARIKAELLAEIKAEQESKQKEKDDLAKSIPKSLVGEGSKGGLSGSDWSGPTDLNAIIGEGG